MHTCVFPQLTIEVLRNGQPENTDAGRERVAQETGTEDRAETPQAESLAGKGAEQTPWPAWAWLGLHKARPEKSLRPPDEARTRSGLSYRVANDKIPQTKNAPIPNIVHVKVDAFLASVEQVLNPKLRGKAVLVGRGTVASASYEAKLRGVETGMTLDEALRICPKAAVVPGQYEHYADFAERVRRILETYTPAVEAAALDDFYLNFAGTERRQPDFRGTLLRLQMEVFKETGLSVSIGAAKTKVVASIASRLESPRGFRVVPVGEEEEFLATLPVERLPGIGHSDAKILAERGVTTIGELRRVPKPALEAAFSEGMGRRIWERARGLDGCEALLRPAERPVSREMAIEGGTTDMEFLGALIAYLSGRVCSALRDSGKQARTMGARLRCVDGFSAHGTVRLEKPSNDELELRAAAKELIETLFTRHAAVDLLGVNVANLEPARQESKVFDQYANRRWSVDRGGALLRRFGQNTMRLSLRGRCATKPNRLALSLP